MKPTITSILTDLYTRITDEIFVLLTLQFRTLEEICMPVFAFSKAGKPGKQRHDVQSLLLMSFKLQYVIYGSLRLISCKYTSLLAT